jgi:large subunit ribosomal protein L1
MEVGKAVQEVKAGKIDFRVDKTGIIHTSVGKVSFSPEKLNDNIQELISTLSRMKPSSAKGTYFRTIHLSTTMSPSIEVDKTSIAGI